MNESDPSGTCTFTGGSLPGVQGNGSCRDAILGLLRGGRSTVDVDLQVQLTTFAVALDRSLVDTEVAAYTNQNIAEGFALNPQQCPSPNACQTAVWAAAGAAGQIISAASELGGVAGRGSGTGQSDLTGAYLGDVAGSSSRLGISILVQNGVWA